MSTKVKQMTQKSALSSFSDLVCGTMDMTTSFSFGLIVV